MATVVLTDIQEIDYFIGDAIDAAGNIIKNPDGTPAGLENIVIESLDESVFIVIRTSENPRQAVLRTTGKLTAVNPDGSASPVFVRARADLILGEGELIAEQIDSIIVTTSQAVGFSTGFGTPRERPLGG